MYNQFAKYYDQIFPVQNQTLNYLTNYLPRGIALDIGCGTGGMAIELAKKGYIVEGMDISQEMINQANKKKKQENVVFLQKGMLDLNEVEKYDGAYCIGNTLVHLKSIHEIREFLLKVKKAVKKHGIFIIQIINYDRILDQNIESLPTIKNENIEMKRNYFLKEDKIVFQTIIQIAGQKPLVDENELYALRQKDLLDELKITGWEVVKKNDGFKEQEIDYNSYSIVIVAKRRD